MKPADTRSQDELTDEQVLAAIRRQAEQRRELLERQQRNQANRQSQSTNLAAHGSTLRPHSNARSRGAPSSNGHNETGSFNDDDDDDAEEGEEEGESESAASGSGSSSMFEYELDSQYEEEKKQFDYDYNKEEFLNPIVVKGPDGTI